MADTVTQPLLKHRTRLNATEKNMQEVLNFLTRVSGKTDLELGNRIAGMSRQTFANRREGKARIRPGEEVALAAAFGVPADLFRKPLDQVLAWLQSDDRGRALLYGTPSEQVIDASGWSDPIAAEAA